MVFTPRDTWRLNRNTPSFPHRLLTDAAHRQWLRWGLLQVMVPLSGHVDYGLIFHQGTYFEAESITVNGTKCYYYGWKFYVARRYQLIYHDGANQ